MPWDRINQDSDRKIFTHPSTPDWSVEEPFEGYGSQDLIVNPPSQGWCSPDKIEVDVDSQRLSVFGETRGVWDACGKTVAIPMVIVCAIVDWMRENNKL